MGSGLIYLIIVGMWIAYFLPRWVATHEEVSGKSMEKFASAMKVVGSKTGNVTYDLEEIEARKANQLIVRRIIFASLVGFTILVILFALVGLVSPVIMTIPISSFGLYIVHARYQIRALQEEMALANSALEFSGKSSSQNYSEIIARSKRAIRELGRIEEEQWTPLAERHAKSESELSGITLLPKGSAQERNTWQPTAVPPPIYVTAPKAAPQRRIIDLTIPGAWSESQDRDPYEVLAPSRDEIFDQELAEEAAEKIRRNRAVNE